MLPSFLGCRRRNIRKPWKSMFSITPLSFDAPSPVNPREYPHKPDSLTYIRRKYACVLKQSALWPFKVIQARLFWHQSKACTYANSYWSSILTLVLSCLVLEILHVFCWKQHPPLSHPNFGGVPLGLDCRCWSPRSENPKLIIRLIYFRTKYIRPRYHNVTNRLTERRTDRRLTTAVPR